MFSCQYEIQPEFPPCTPWLITKPAVNRSPFGLQGPSAGLESENGEEFSVVGVVPADAAVPVQADKEGAAVNEFEGEAAGADQLLNVAGGVDGGSFAAYGCGKAAGGAARRFGKRELGVLALKINNRV